MIDSNGKIVSTEYASENNSLGKPYGDGYTARLEVVCTTRFAPAKRAMATGEACASDVPIDGRMATMDFPRTIGHGFFSIIIRT
jgi:hypothetical protein